ncbi:MAG TPA: hypothetical protein VHL09_12205 [Dehalococcoidia bacterium]|nr:hypothetical protein [Dehalococcoidia bacterium]
MTISADVKCYYCGHVSGKISGEAGAPFKRDSFEPAAAHAGEAIPVGQRFRCLRCGGPVFLDDVQYSRRPTKLPTQMPRRRRHQSEPARKAS